jgi:hypothetical protein
MREFGDFLANWRAAQWAAGWAAALALFDFLRAVAQLVLVAAWPGPPSDTGSTLLNLTALAFQPYVSRIGAHSLSYGPTLFNLGATALLLPLGLYVVRRLGFRSWGVLQTCSSCLAHVPLRASVCRFCTRDVEVTA